MLYLLCSYYIYLGIYLIIPPFRMKFYCCGVDNGSGGMYALMIAQIIAEIIVFAQI